MSKNTPLAVLIAALCVTLAITGSIALSAGVPAKAASTGKSAGQSIPFLQNQTTPPVQNFTLPAITNRTLPNDIQNQTVWNQTLPPPPDPPTTTASCVPDCKWWNFENQSLNGWTLGGGNVAITSSYAHSGSYSISLPGKSGQNVFMWIPKVLGGAAITYLSCWFDIPVTSGSIGGDNANPSGFISIINHNEQEQLTLIPAGNQYWIECFPGAAYNTGVTFTIGVWHFVQFVDDGSNYGTIYVDGQSLGSNEFIEPGTPADSVTIENYA